jgi:hypothetical protein
VGVDMIFDFGIFCIIQFLGWAPTFVGVDLTASSGNLAKSRLMMPILNHPKGHSPILAFFPPPPCPLHLHPRNMNGNGICHAYFSSCRVSDEFFLKITKKGIFGQIFLCLFCQMPGPLGRAIFYRIAYPMGIWHFTAGGIMPFRYGIPFFLWHFEKICKGKNKF